MTPGYGQVQTRRAGTIADYNRYWISAGAGHARYPSVLGTLSVQPRSKPFVATARYTVSGEVLSEPLPGVKIAEVAAMGGIRLRNVILSTGISYVWGVDRGARIGPAEPGALFRSDRYEKKEYRNVGLPMEARFVLPLKYIGVGLTAFSNLNRSHSYGGLTISLYAGRL
jgi:hypothetical protein